MALLKDNTKGNLCGFESNRGPLQNNIKGTAHSRFGRSEPSSAPNLSLAQPFGKPSHQMQSLPALSLTHTRFLSFCLSNE